MRRINVLSLTSKNANQRLFSILLADKTIRYLGNRGIQETLHDQPRGLDPDVILLYETAAKPNYNWLLSKTKALFETARVLVLGDKRRDDLIMKVLSLGGDGYMACPMEPQHLICAIKDAEQGVMWAPRRVLSEMVRRLSPARAEALPDPMLQKLITPRESDIINLLVRGLTNKDIAASLGLQEITIKVNISRLLHKLQFKNRCALVSAVVAGRATDARPE